MNTFPEEVPSEIDELLQTACYMEEGNTKISLLEEAVRRADMTGDYELQYQTRDALIHSAVFGGRHDIALVAFTWCLATSDAHPGEFDEHNLLWKYKWIADALPDFPTLTRGQIVGALADMQARYEKAGFSQQPVETMRWKCHQYMGELEQAREVFAKASKMRRDSSSDCAACVQNSQVEFYSTLGDYQASVKAAEKIRSGRLSCAHVPHGTYAHLLWPLFSLGQVEEAMECHRKGYRLVRRNPTFVQEYGEHLLFLALTANTTKALQLLGTHAATALEHPAARARFEFLRAATFTLMSLQAAGKTTAKLRVPPTVPFARSEGVYPVEELLAWFQQTTGELAAQFDRRNENSYFTERLEQLPSLLARIQPHPVTVKKRASDAKSDEAALE